MFSINKVLFLLATVDDYAQQDTNKLIIPGIIFSLGAVMLIVCVVVQNISRKKKLKNAERLKRERIKKFSEESNMRYGSNNQTMGMPQMQDYDAMPEKNIVTETVDQYNNPYQNSTMTNQMNSYNNEANTSIASGNDYQNQGYDNDAYSSQMTAGTPYQSTMQENNAYQESSYNSYNSYDNTQSTDYNQNNYNDYNMQQSMPMNTQDEVKEETKEESNIAELVRKRIQEIEEKKRDELRQGTTTSVNKKVNTNENIENKVSKNSEEGNEIKETNEEIPANTNSIPTNFNFTPMNQETNKESTPEKKKYNFTYVPEYKPGEEPKKEESKENKPEQKIDTNSNEIRKDESNQNSQKIARSQINTIDINKNNSAKTNEVAEKKVDSKTDNNQMSKEESVQRLERIKASINMSKSIRRFEEDNDKKDDDKKDNIDNSRSSNSNESKEERVPSLPKIANQKADYDVNYIKNVQEKLNASRNESHEDDKKAENEKLKEEYLKKRIKLEQIKSKFEGEKQEKAVLYEAGKKVSLSDMSKTNSNKNEEAIEKKVEIKTKDENTGFKTGKISLGSNTSQKVNNQINNDQPKKVEAKVISNSDVQNEEVQKAKEKAEELAKLKSQERAEKIKALQARIRKELGEKKEEPEKNQNNNNANDRLINTNDRENNESSNASNTQKTQDELKAEERNKKIEAKLKASKQKANEKQEVKEEAKEEVKPNNAVLNQIENLFSSLSDREDSKKVRNDEKPLQNSTNQDTDDFEEVITKRKDISSQNIIEDSKKNNNQNSNQNNQNNNEIVEDKHEINIESNMSNENQDEDYDELEANFLRLDSAKKSPKHQARVEQEEEQKRKTEILERIKKTKEAQELNNRVKQDAEEKSKNRIELEARKPKISLSSFGMDLDGNAIKTPIPKLEKENINNKEASNAKESINTPVMSKLPDFKTTNEVKVQKEEDFMNFEKQRNKVKEVVDKVKSVEAVSISHSFMDEEGTIIRKKKKEDLQRQEARKLIQQNQKQDPNKLKEEQDKIARTKSILNGIDLEKEILSKRTKTLSTLKDAPNYKKVIAVISPENSGKTTVAVNMAYELANRGIKTCIIDTDNIKKDIYYYIHKEHIGCLSKLNECKNVEEMYDLGIEVNDYLVAFTENKGVDYEINYSKLCKLIAYAEEKNDVVIVDVKRGIGHEKFKDILKISSNILMVIDKKITTLNRIADRFAKVGQAFLGKDITLVVNMDEGRGINKSVIKSIFKHLDYIENDVKKSYSIRLGEIFLVNYDSKSIITGLISQLPAVTVKENHIIADIRKIASHFYND